MTMTNVLPGDAERRPEDILEHCLKEGYPRDRRQVDAEMEVQILCTRIIETSVNRLRTATEAASVASDRLGRRVYWLNWLIAVLTAAGIVIGGLSLWRGWSPPKPVVIVQSKAKR
jgi:hypothetical protein